MNPVKLRFRHGGEMLVSPIGLRFVEDPDHGPLVLIPELPGPRGYQLDMTLDQARQAFWVATLAAQIPAPGEITRLEEQLEALARRYSRYESLDAEFLAGNAARWQALAIHLGLPEGWEHLHEEAAEVKGALVSQAEILDRLYSAVFESSFGLLDRMDLRVVEIDALRKEAKESWELRSQIQDELRDLIMGRVERLEQAMIDRVGGLERLTGCLCTYGMTERKANEIDSVKAHVDALYNELGLNSRWEGEKLVSYRDTDSILTEVVLMQREVSRLTEESSLFTVAEKVGELEESRRIQREFLAKLSDEVRSLKAFQEEIYPTLSEKWEDTAFPLLDDRTCVRRQTTGPIEITWTHAGPCNAATGQPIDCSSWRAPEKPKSAWKPLIECNQYGAFMMKRRTGQGGGVVLHASRNFEGWTFVTSQNASGDAWKPNQYPEHYEFCPIPE